jgi:hypothetical protein
VLLHAFVLVVAAGSRSPAGWALVMTYGIIPILTLGLASLLRRAPVPTCDLTIVGILAAIVGLTVVTPCARA